jgi:cytosine permease
MVEVMKEKKKSAGMGSDDYSLSRVPEEGKNTLFRVVMIRLGVLSCLPVMMVGAQLGYGLPFWWGFVAVLIGSVILQVVGWALGTIAAKEGLSTSLLSRWTGFGKFGSTLIGIIIAIVCFGWFGIQNSVFAEGLAVATGVLNTQIWAVISGIGITFIVIFGFKAMGWTANIALPLFFAGAIYAFVKLVQGNDLSVAMTEAAPGAAISMGAAITMVSGSYIMGAVITPDMTRFLRNGKQVFISVLISTFVGEGVFCSFGSIMAHVAESADITTVMYTISGALGMLLVVTSTVKANDVNLYVASLGVANFFETLTGKKFHRGTTTLVIGVIGTVLSVLGILNFFANFLTILGTAIPPLAGIMVVDYFFLKRSRKELDESRAKGELPAQTESFNPIAIITWVISAVIGFYVTNFGVASINSLVISMVLYCVLMKLFDPKLKKAKQGSSSGAA